MTRAHALELVLAADDDAAVRTRWRHLEQTGLPSLAQHRGATHRPHVSVASSPQAPEEDVLAVASDRWAELLPLPLTVSALVVLGERRMTVAELLSPPVLVRSAQAELVSGWAGADERPWVPHLSLSTGLRAAQVGQVLEALSTQGGDRPTQRTVHGLRWWNPDAGTVTTLAGEAG